MNLRCRRFPRRALGPAVAVASVLMLSVPACSTDEKTAPEKPPTPKMPAGCEVVEDHLITGADLASVEQKLGVKLTGLRNTMFEVDGKWVKVNTLVASDTTNAEAVMAKIGDMKPIEFLVRKGLYVYEFVCQDDAIPQQREGREHLAGK